MRVVRRQRIGLRFDEVIELEPQDLRNEREAHQDPASSIRRKESEM